MKRFVLNHGVLTLLACGFLVTAFPSAQWVFAQQKADSGETEVRSASDEVIVGTVEDPLEAPAADDLNVSGRRPLSEEFQDLSFERYVDLRLIGDAVDDRDSVLLTDVALQLAEGERILLRNHKSGLTAKKLMSKAAKLALDNQDQPSLERLLKAAQAMKDDKLIAGIKDSRELAGKSRATDPALAVSLETTNVGTLTEAMGWINAVRSAELLGDNVELKSLRESIDGAEGLSKSQREAIAKSIDNATKAEADEQDSILGKLAGESRGLSASASFEVGPIKVDVKAKYDAKKKIATITARAYGKVFGHTINIASSETKVTLGDNLKLEKKVGSYPTKVKFVGYFTPQKHGLEYSCRLELNNSVKGSKKGVIRW